MSIISFNCLIVEGSSKILISSVKLRMGQNIYVLIGIDPGCYAAPIQVNPLIISLPRSDGGAILSRVLFSSETGILPQ